MFVKIKCIIVDDDPVIVTLIENYVKKTDFLQLVGTCNNAVDATKVLNNEKVDLIFLDVEMPEMTGLELINTLERKPQVVLMTAKKEYALEAFEYDVTDYMLKPVGYARFLKAAQKVKQQFELINKLEEEDEKDFIFLKADSLFVNFKYTDIDYVEAYGDYVKIKTPEKTYVVLSTLKSMDDKLPLKYFQRVHRSYIVRLDKIKNIGESTITINNDHIPISNSFKTQLMERLNLK